MVSGGHQRRSGRGALGFRRTKTGVAGDVVVVAVVTVVVDNMLLLFVLVAAGRPWPDLCCMIQLDKTSFEGSEEVPPTLGTGLPDIA